MEDFIRWLCVFPPVTSYFIVAALLIIIILIKSETIITVYKWITKRKTVRSCSDCILIVFGIREKHQQELNNLNHNILRSQMSYFEQKIHELTLWMINSYQDDLDTLGKGKPNSLRLSQFGNYQEALKNAMWAVKDEVRKSFKENGFADMNDIEFSSYLKAKTRGLISISLIHRCSTTR